MVTDSIDILIGHRMVYRSWGPGKPPAMIGCGFMLKPGKTKDAVDSLVNHYSLVYVLRGAGIYVDKSGTRRELKSGDCFQRFPQWRHSLLLDPESNWAECFIALDTRTQLSFEHLGLIDGNLPLFTPGRSLNLTRSFDELFCGISNSATENELGHCVCSAANILLDIKEMAGRSVHSSREARMLDVVRTALVENVSSRENLEFLLAGRGLSYGTLRKPFQKRFGISMEEFRIRHRIDLAIAMLQEEGASVKDIAYRLGYLTPYAFSAQFKKITGTSPKRYHKHVMN